MDGRDEPAMTMELSNRENNFFIIFVDAIFTSLFTCPFTNNSMMPAQTQLILACIRGAPAVNSLAT